VIYYDGVSVQENLSMYTCKTIPWPPILWRSIVFVLYVSYNSLLWSSNSQFSIAVLNCFTSVYMNCKLSSRINRNETRGVVGCLVLLHGCLGSILLNILECKITRSLHPSECIPCCTVLGSLNLAFFGVARNGYV
jgi:hypothetical protein